MRLEQQVCSLELAKKLKELGVNQESMCVWVDRPGRKPQLVFSEQVETQFAISAFTVAELETLLPDKLEFKPETWAYLRMTQRQTAYEDLSGYHPYPLCGDDNIADSRAKLLCYLLENKLIST